MTAVGDLFNAHKPWRTLRAASLVAVALACTPQFDHATTIKDMRLLAVVAEPPEILVDLVLPPEAPPSTALEMLIPEPLPSFVLEPLVVDPRAEGRLYEYRVLACGNQPLTLDRGRDRGPGNVQDTIAQAPCPAEALVVAEGTVVGTADGRVPLSATFTPTVPFLLEALRADPLGAVMGLPITVAFTIRAEEEQVVAIKRVIFSPRLSPEHLPNSNPRIDAVFYRNERSEVPVPWDEADLPQVPLGGKLRVSASRAEAEPYEARGYSRTERQITVYQVAKETLRYSFYATQGTFSPANVSSEPLPIFNDPVTDLESTYQAPRTLEPGERREVDVFVVVRDERGGASFVRTRLRLQD
jgi:hypothetical protein